MTEQAKQRSGILPAADCEIAAARREIARLQQEVSSLLHSRSWQLSKPYRALGMLAQRLLGRPPHTVEPSVPTTSRNDAADIDPWGRWPVWTTDESFSTRRFDFVASLTRFDRHTSDDLVAILKYRDFLQQIYRRLLTELTPKRVLEIGFFQGGMPLFIADMASPEKIVGIDVNPPLDSLKRIIARAGLSESVKLYGDVMQNDTPVIQNILANEFGGEPLDLIIDDCSHEYENSKVCFEEYFGYLRPGGQYVIEDWGWLHWPGDEWQTERSIFWGKPAMTNLIFELIMALGSTQPAIIERIEILTGACVVVTRGSGLAYRQRVSLDDVRRTSGRAFQPF